MITLGSKDEATQLVNIFSQNNIWTGGTRTTKDSKGTHFNDEESIESTVKYNNFKGVKNNGYYWACGPETGTLILDNLWYRGNDYNEPNNFKSSEFFVMMQKSYNFTLNDWGEPLSNSKHTMQLNLAAMKRPVCQIQVEEMSLSLLNHKIKM